MLNFQSFINAVFNRASLRPRGSRYRPHEGKQEVERRARQIADGRLTAANGLVASESDDMRERRISAIGATAVEDAIMSTRSLHQGGVVGGSGGRKMGEALTGAGTGLDGNAARAIAESLIEDEQGFKFDEPVSWVSSNTPKSGRVIQVIPAGRLPSDFGVKLKDAGTPRDHESYVVRGHPVDRHGEKAGSATNYWPRVSLLKRAS